MTNEYFDHSLNVVPSGTRARADHINNVANEIASGLDKLPTEQELKQGGLNYALDTGAADAYVIALKYLPQLTDGLAITFKVGASNTGASTVDVNGLGAKSLKHADGTDLTANDIALNQIVSARYNGTEFRITSSTPNLTTRAETAVTASGVSESNALESEQNADASEASALGAAGAAASDAGVASTKANEASASATAASGSATAASGSAATATTRASEASTSATAASGSATAASGSATAAANSAIVANAGVTFEALSSNDDVGSSAGQVAAGNHGHLYRGCLAYDSGGSQTIGTRAAESLSLNSNSYDTDVIHDLSTRLTDLTVPVGVTKVKLVGNVVFDITSFEGNVQAFFRKNGVAGFAGIAMATDSLRAETGSHLNLSSPVLTVIGGDRFELSIFQTTEVDLQVITGELSGSWFSMEIIE